MAVCEFGDESRGNKAICLSSEISDDGCHEMSFFIRNISNSDKILPQVSIS